MLDRTAIFYRRQEGGNESKLSGIIAESLNGYALETCDSVAELQARLRTRGCTTIILILMVLDEYEMADIVAIKPLLEDMRIVIVLPDARDEMIAMAHSIHPRFLSCMDGDLQEVAAVLKNIKR